MSYTLVCVLFILCSIYTFALVLPRHFPVRHFPVLQIPPLRLGPSFSSPANSSPANSAIPAKVEIEFDQYTNINTLLQAVRALTYDGVKPENI